MTCTAGTVPSKYLLAIFELSCAFQPLDRYLSGTQGTSPLGKAEYLTPRIPPLFSSSASASHPPPPNKTPQHSVQGSFLPPLHPVSPQAASSKKLHLATTSKDINSDLAYFYPTAGFPTVYPRTNRPFYFHLLPWFVLPSPGARARARPS